jgi:hypothetical protein
MVGRVVDLNKLNVGASVEVRSRIALRDMVQLVTSVG